MENIVKIQKITNIGLFKNYVTPINNDFTKNNFIYGENASGKSTLSQVFQLFDNGESEKIDLKKTIGESGNIEIDVGCKDGNSLKYSNNTILNNNGFKIKVFNSNFINENVYNGSNLEFRRFYGTISENSKSDIIGKYKIKEKMLKSEIEVMESEIKEIETNLTNYLNGKAIELNRKYNSKIGSSVLTLNNISQNISVKYKYKEKIDIVNKLEEELNMLKQSENERIYLLNDEYKSSFYGKNEIILDILGSKIEKLEEEFIVLMKERIREYTEKWLKEGYSYIENNNLKNCPLCQNSLSENEIIEDYKKYFTDKSTIIRSELNEIIELIEKEKNEILNIDFIKVKEEILKFERLLKKNEIEKIMEIKFDEKLNEKYNYILSVLVNKRENIDKEFIIERNFYPDLSWIQQCKEVIKIINEQLLNISKKLTEIRKELFSNMSFIVTEEKREEILKMEEKKKILSIKKIESISLATELEKNLSKSIMEVKYINEFLQKMNLNKYRVNSNFEIELNNILVDRVKFEFVLSEGEKTTLAFAYFLANIKSTISDNELNNLVIILDDPISSLDDNRIFSTAYLIKNIWANLSKNTEIQRLNKLAEKLSVKSQHLKLFAIIKNKIDNYKDKEGQLIVLSHNLIFLNKLYSFFNPNTVNSYFVLRRDMLLNQPELLKFNKIDSMIFDTTYVKKLMKIYKIANKDYGNLDEYKDYIGNDLRTVLESFFKFKFPNKTANYYISDRGKEEKRGTIFSEEIEKYVKENMEIKESNLFNGENIVNQENFGTNFYDFMRIFGNMFSHGERNHINQVNFTSTQEIIGACQKVVNIINAIDCIHMKDTVEYIKNSALK